MLEDESALMTLMRHAEGVHTNPSRQAEGAIRIFSEHSRQVHLPIADVTLPKSSGIQVALLLRLEDLDLPVLLTSRLPSQRLGWNGILRSATTRLRGVSFQSPLKLTGCRGS